MSGFRLTRRGPTIAVQIAKDAIMLVNWSFISQLAGGRRLIGYVPAANLNASGVTVATGVDLGGLPAARVAAMSIPDALKAKLKIYAGRTGEEAREVLRENPLRLSSSEAEALDDAVRVPMVRRLSAAYDAAIVQRAGSRRFSELPEAAQTVIVSVASRRGADLNRTAPRFWETVASQNWPGAVHELESCGDARHSRRLREAELLKTLYA